MSFRTRIAVLAAAAVAVAVVAASLVVYVVVRETLRDEVDESLRERSEVATLRAGPSGGFAVLLPTARLGGAGGYAQIVEAEPAPFQPPVAELPVGARDRAVAAGTEDDYFEDADVDGVHVRIFTRSIAAGLAIRLARPLDEVDDTLSRLRLILALVGVGGVGGAAALGLLVSGAALRPVRRLTETAEHVAVTHDLSQRIGGTGDDELSRLGRSFDSMLAALEGSLAAQRQLVADASHELRTPLTSLRTNIEVLAGSKRLRTEERRRLLGDVVAQIEELTALVGDLVELARDGERPQELVDVRLDELVAAAVERARRHDPAAVFDVDLDPTVVRGAPERIDRAIANLLDNALKWNPGGQPIEVSVGGGEVVVRDHGPGIADEDLPRVFDRFYRAPGVRATPGSGLGLAIVRQVAEAHGGSVTAERPPDGGARLRLRFLDSS